jgi:uncharacterized membrane protein
MKHFVILLLVAVITITIVLLVYRPDLLEDVWLWIVGLIGPIIAIAKAGIKSLSKFIKSLG